MDKDTIKKKIKEEMIDELKYGDSVDLCCDNIIEDDWFSELPPEEEDELVNMIFDEWRKYADKIEKFLKSID